MNEDETLSIKYPSLSTIDWDVLRRVDNQMQEALEQCQRDSIQYEQVFQNTIKEIRVLQYEYTKKPAFRSYIFLSIVIHTLYK